MKEAELEHLKRSLPTSTILWPISQNSFSVDSFIILYLSGLPPVKKMWSLELTTWSDLQGVVSGHISYISIFTWKSKKLKLGIIISPYNIHMREIDCDFFFLCFVLLLFFSCSWASGAPSVRADPLTKTSGFPWRPLAFPVHGHLRGQHHPGALVPRGAPGGDRRGERHLCGGQHHPRLLPDHTVIHTSGDSQAGRQGEQIPHLQPASLKRRSGVS